MLRRACNWLLLVLPPGWVVTFAFSTWLVIEGLAAFLHWQFPVPGVADPLLRARDAFAIAACAALGLYRVAGFHPLFKDAYRRWLSFTPWRRGLPLPVGPVHLAPQDAAVLAVILVLLHDAQLPRSALPAAFLLTYLIGLLVSFARLGYSRAAYVLTFALGLAIRLGLITPPGLALLALLVVASQFVLSRTLDDFPWRGRLSLDAMRDPEHQKRLAVLSVGWPFLQLRPNGLEFGIRYRHGILLSLLGGWWTYCLCGLISNAEAREAIEQSLLYFLPLLIVFRRLRVYLSNHRSPIGLLGRLLTLRWIIPSYDQVFAAPLCILLTLLFAPAAIDSWSVRLGVPLPTPHLVITLALLEALNLGPTVKCWHLTSACR
ncbi:MAG TPA: hypothetical protein VN699_14540, partial [Pirellulales bacterium]|nr:hypothetical protein [Pirellulales bacterium]